MYRDGQQGCCKVEWLSECREVKSHVRKIMLGFKILDGKCNLMWATEQLTKFCERNPGIIFYHPCICFNIFPKKVLITVPPHPHPPKKCKNLEWDVVLTVNCQLHCVHQYSLWYIPIKREKCPSPHVTSPCGAIDVPNEEFKSLVIRLCHTRNRLNYVSWRKYNWLMSMLWWKLIVFIQFLVDKFGQNILHS